MTRPSTRSSSATCADIGAALVRRSYRRDARAQDAAQQVFGRAPDVVLRKQAQAGAPATSLRLWLAPLRFEGRAVYLVQVSRPVGGRFAPRGPGESVLHDDMDEARNLLVQDMMYSGGLARLGFRPRRRPALFRGRPARRPVPGDAAAEPGGCRVPGLGACPRTGPEDETPDPARDGGDPGARRLRIHAAGALLGRHAAAGAGAGRRRPACRTSGRAFARSSVPCWQARKRRSRPPPLRGRADPHRQRAAGTGRPVDLGPSKRRLIAAWWPASATNASSNGCSRPARRPRARAPVRL